MGRGRGKGRTFTVNHHDDGGSGEEKNRGQKRRGRPQKPLEDGIDGEESDKIVEEEDSEMENGSAPMDTEMDNGKKRKRNSQGKGKSDENVNGISSIADECSKSNGFRQNGSRRRKSKPRRAAEAGVDCR